VRVLLDCVRPDRDCDELRNVGSTVTIDPYSPLAGRKAELLRWLTEEGRFAPDTGRLLELLCDKLAALGIPIARATVHVRTLHPEYRGAAFMLAPDAAGPYAAAYSTRSRRQRQPH
jgi:hypothetical protein